MPLFEVAILEIPTKEMLDRGATERLAFGPACVIAKDVSSAALKAVLENPSKAKEITQDRMQVLVRPFA